MLEKQDWKSPDLTHTIFDLEATSVDPEEAEIIEIAAIHPIRGEFHRYVTTEKIYASDHEVWGITKIDSATYEKQKQPLRKVLEDFIQHVADTPLAGHNIAHYDLPLLTRHLEALDLSLPPNSLPHLDTLRWAQLLYPTPPDDLGGYSLGKLYEKFTGQPIPGAHQALNDCRANLEVLKGLLANRPDDKTLKLWGWLELPEAKWYGAESIDETKLVPLLQNLAAVRWVNQPGHVFPGVPQLGSELVGSSRPSQQEMMHSVARTLALGQQLLIQAPTGTGKTRGYLYPAHHSSHQLQGEKILVATHTKVLQQQALAELERSAELGFATKAVAVKSPREYICLEALHEIIENRRQASLEERYAQGMLGAYTQNKQFDLGAIPQYWESQLSYREVKFQTQTNPSRCRSECAFFLYCAYQTDQRQRQEADFWITNQAWLLAHLGSTNDQTGEQSPPSIHLIIDEAHNLEEVATQAFSQSFGEEESRLHLRRIYDVRKRQGWLRDNSRVPEFLVDRANQIRQQLIPDALDKLEKYSQALTQLLKQYGRGEIQFGLSIALGPEIRKKPEWPKLRILEDNWIASLRNLRSALREFPRDSWIERNMRDSLEYFKQQIDLLYERRASLRERPDEDSDPNLIHLSELHQGSGWIHIAQPVEIAPQLQRVWQQAKSLTLTSATLAVGGDFTYIRRTLGLPKAQEQVLSETLPYKKAHLLIPSHLPESRSSTLRRFQSLYHIELETLLSKVRRSLSLFTSSQRMKQARDYLEKQIPDLYVPITRREREDIAQRMSDRTRAGAALGTRAYMEGVDFRDLGVVNLERIPFPIPTPLLQKRQELAESKGLDPWRDVYLPKALLTFVQAFGRLVRDDRSEVGDGAFILWDKRLLNASYQQLFFKALPKGVNLDFPETRRDFYSSLAEILQLDPNLFPHEELRDDTLVRLEQIRNSQDSSEQKAKMIAEVFWKIDLEATDRGQTQLKAIRSDLAAEDLMVLLPTSFGKSLTFQIPALVSGGLTLVISPLIALMRDQVEGLQEKGLPAAAIHSFLSGAEQRSIMDEVVRGRVNLLYVSPERVNRSQDLQNMLRDLARQGQLRRLVLDEAHCLSMWGQDFRPDYVQMNDVLRKLCPNLPISVLTATATPKVREDLQQILRLKNPVLVSSSYDRPNLSYYSYKLTNDIKKMRQLSQILEWLRQNHPHDGAIVYASTRNQVERLAWALDQLGYSVRPYHAGLSTFIRTEAQEQFMKGEVQVMIATNAFGMGVDKENVRVVIHYNPPSSLPAYIQEAGRAGRDEKAAYAILFHNASDWRMGEFINRQGNLKFYHATAITEVLGQSQGHWSGYADSLVEAINTQLNDEQSDLEKDGLAQLLGSLEETKFLNHHYRVGKVFVLCSDTERLANQLGSGMEILRQLGFKGGDLGDELDLALLPEQQAEELNNRLYDLWRQRILRVYTNREPALELSQVGFSLHRFTQRQSELHKGRQERLEEMQRYAESNHCKRALLLAAFEEHIENCAGCQSCNGDDAPWKSALPFEEQEFEAIYKPMETLLRFLESHQSSAREENYNGLGPTKLIMALHGDEQSFSDNKPFKLSYREVANPYFGHLSFIKEREIKKAIEEASQKGYILKIPHKDGSVCRITEAGIKYLNRERRLGQRRGSE